MAIMSSVRTWLFMLVVVMLVPHGRGLLTDPGPCHPCHALYTEEFMEACGNYLQPGLLYRLRYYCLLKMDNMDYLNEHLTSIEGICSAKYDAVELTIPDCPEIDLVFMVQVSNQVGNIGVEKFKSFLTSTLNHDNLKELISSGSVDIGIMSFSEDLKVILNLNDPVNDPIEMVNNIALAGITTQTQDAIVEFSNQLDSTSDRRQVGVLLTVGTSTDWRKTVLSMRDLYENHPNGKVIVVNLLESSHGCPTGEIRAMATGVGDDNLIQGFSLDLEEKTDELVDMILADHEPEECSQLLALRDEGPDMECLEGVYEITEPCDDVSNTYKHTSGKHWMAHIHFGPDRLWVIMTNQPAAGCTFNGDVVAITSLPGPINDAWRTPINVAANMKVVCFN